VLGQNFSCGNLGFCPGNLQEESTPTKVSDHRKYKVKQFYLLIFHASCLLKVSFKAEWYRFWYVFCKTAIFYKYS